MTDNRLLAFERLLNIMDELREKCPWDKKQTFESLRTLTMEETYELTDAIAEEDWKGVKEEIGDVLLHMVFYSKLGDEKGYFNIESVLTTICDKLVHRHPHIYGDTKAETEAEVKANWEKIKLAEGKKSVLQGVTNSLPAMVKAMRIQEKVKGVGFDWENAAQVYEKVDEELQELQEALESNNQEEIEGEFGDVLFSLINYARFINVNPENALEKTNKKFIRRFQQMENDILAADLKMDNLNLNELDVFWNAAKQREK